MLEYYRQEEVEEVTKEATSFFHGISNLFLRNFGGRKSDKENMSIGWGGDSVTRASMIGTPPPPHPPPPSLPIASSFASPSLSSLLFFLPSSFLHPPFSFLLLSFPPPQ